MPSSSGSVTSYGANKIETSISIDERLVYTWKDIDVYGEKKAEDSFWTRMKNKCCRCCSSSENQVVSRKHLLKNITGIAYGGEILAVMGASGAGKTTLLNTLSFRSPRSAKISKTSVRAINGTKVNSKIFRSLSAYVQQDDLFIASLTAKEHLIFQAKLRMGNNIPYRQKMERVDEVINELSLRKCANTTIGCPGRIKGLSGGELKRLSFASEILTDPKLLICDEVCLVLNFLKIENFYVLIIF